MKFIAYEISASIQQSKFGKRVTRLDLVYAIRSANLSLFPGITQYSFTNRWNGGPLGYVTTTRIYYVVGIDENLAEIKWACYLHPDSERNYHYSEDVYYKEFLTDRTLIKTWKGSPSSIYKDLTISKGESKIIVEHAILVTKQPKGKTLGLFLYNPTKLPCVIVIFTPKPGTFDPNKPPQ